MLDLSVVDGGPTLNQPWPSSPDFVEMYTTCAVEVIIEVIIEVIKIIKVDS